MPVMERSEIGIPIWPVNPSTGNRRRGPLRSRTVDTLLHILSICYADSSHITQNSDKSHTLEESVTKDDSVDKEETNVDETKVILGTQEEEFCNTHVEPVEQDHNISEERKDLSSPHLVTDKDVEEGEIAGEFLNLIPEDDVASVDKTGSEHEDFVGIESEFEKNNSLTSLSIDTVDDIGKGMAVVVSKTKRNLVDYSEIALQSNITKSATKNQDFASPVKNNGTQNNKKRPGSCTVEKRTNKKARKSVDQSTCPQDLTTNGENPQEVIGASANKDADTEKKRKRVLTAERKAKKKKKERIKRAEKNRKLGVKRLKLQPMIPKEKKISYCRHYMNGRCHEGENCKFSHDTIPLTKSKPCCHFARHSCMKGDSCPFDHQLSKYPCSNYLSKGFCPRGSDCMFSHKAQTSETSSLNTPNESTSEHKKSPSSSSKVQIYNNGPSPKPSVQLQPPKGVSFITREKIDTKLSPQPPKGISFKLPLEAQLSPKVNSEVKESVEITKTPPVVPRGINFLSFGKKPGGDGSNCGFSFKIGKSPLSKSEEGIIVNTDDKKGTVSESPTTDGQTCSRRPVPVLPFLSSASQRTLQSTLAFAAKFDSGVKSSRLGI
ncbi:hypothetical protein LXL04_007640 [Taraxacum kok-saghyz]